MSAEPDRWPIVIKARVNKCSKPAGITAGFLFQPTMRAVVSGHGVENRVTKPHFGWINHQINATMPQIWPAAARTRSLDLARSSPELREYGAIGGTITADRIIAVAE